MWFAPLGFFLQIKSCGHNLNPQDFYIIWECCVSIFRNITVIVMMTVQTLPESAGLPTILLHDMKTTDYWIQPLSAVQCSLTSQSSSPPAAEAPSLVHCCLWSGNAELVTQLHALPWPHSTMLTEGFGEVHQERPINMNTPAEKLCNCRWVQILTK